MKQRNFDFDSKLIFGDFSVTDNEVMDFIRDAELGDADAQYALGLCYVNGYGVDTDYAEAEALLRKAAEQGHTKAFTALGMLYYFCSESDEDIKEAISFFKSAAEQGNAEAMFCAGLCFEGAEKYREAARWYKKAAECGHADAQFSLSKYYTSGIGVKANARKATDWLELAADNGSADAQFVCGFCFEEAHEFAKAKKWYTLAAEQGHEAAIEHLAKLNDIK